MNKDFELRRQMGERIRAIRNEMNMTKGGLAKQMGDTGKFLGVVESGKSDISYDKLKKLCDISGYSSDYILFGRDTSLITKTKQQLKCYDEEQIKTACNVINNIAILIKDNGI